jgi:transglutaminase-like putative cysteine protease/tetratricopeptide (TPR) repeat protein
MKILVPFLKVRETTRMQMTLFRRTRTSLCRPLSLIYLALLLTGRGFGQISAWSLDGPSFQASPSEILAAAGKIVPEKYAQATVLYEEDHNVFDSAGKVTNVHRLIYRIETQAGIDAWSESSVEWEAFYQNEPTIRARVIRPDGSATELDRKTITDVPAQNEGDGTYSDERIHKAPLPGLTTGAIVETETTRTDKEPYFSAGGVYRFYFQRGVPIIRTRLIVEVPAALPLQFRVDQLPDIAVRDETAAGVRRIIFGQGHLAPLVNSDINLTTRVPRNPFIELSTGKSWEVVAQSYRLLAEPQIKPDEVKEFLRGTTQAATAPSATEARLAFIQALVSKLHKEVRYTGIEFGQSKLEPQPPSEVLKRHYGDCKDKASLLVAMLRASGIQADIALLNAGPGRDVTAELPGMNQFDHAIVYVPPAAPGEKSLWIDATAEFTRVGDLPYGDQGRLALIIADGTKELTLTPDARPEDSVLIETRDFLLADYGFANAVETSQTTGYIDSYYRSQYGDSGNKALRASLETYVRGAYAAKTLTNVASGNPSDFTKPFSLRLEIDKTKRANTGIPDAVIYLFPTGAFANLPRWFAVDPDQGNQKLSSEEEDDRRKSQESRSTEYDLQPFVAERRYRITPPPGFLLRALPSNKVVAMGPATLTETYSADATGMILAVFRFDTGKCHYTTEEVLALRKTVIAANKEDAVAVFFDQAGAKQIAAGKVREALNIDRGLIAARPNDPLPHIRMAYALLTTGVGELAKSEAEKATALAPKSAVAFASLGWILQFDSIGVHFGKGSDLNGALQAYRKSKELDPETLETRLNLAILYEYDANGIRYASVPGMQSAIAEYRELAKVDKPTGEQNEDNVLYDLLYSHRYKELLAEVEPLPSTAARNALGISATVAIADVAAGMKRADRISGDATDRSTALQNAGAQLIALRMYPQAAAVLYAGVQGQDNAAASDRRIEILRDLKPYVPPVSPYGSPTAVIQRMFVAGLSNTLDETEFSRLLSRHAFFDERAWQTNLSKSASSAGAFGAPSLHTASLADIVLGAMKLSSKGDDAIGYRVTCQPIGAASQQFFVTREGSDYKIIASQGDFGEVGNAALYFLHQGNEAQARNLLDWKREFLHRGGGDDPLSGPLMPRFWTSGESKGAEAIELAAASLLMSDPHIAELLAAIAVRRDKWTAAQGKPDQTDLNLLLAHGYFRMGDGPNTKKASEALLKDWPDSNTAILLAGRAYALQRDWPIWNQMLASHLARHPADRDLLLLEAGAAQVQGKFVDARKTLRTVLDGSEATSSDYNNYSWNALFEKNVDAEAIQAAQQANVLTKNGNFAYLHTLACLYAAQGKTAEAKQVLLQAMTAGNLAAPNPASWFGFGVIYEQYGVKDAAISAFKKIEKPDGPIAPTDIYVLAQEHLNELRAAN